MACVTGEESLAVGIVDCDLALALLRVQVRQGSCDERELARLAIDDVLDRRNALLTERGRIGAQS